MKQEFLYLCLPVFSNNFTVLFCLPILRLRSVLPKKIKVNTMPPPFWINWSYRSNVSAASNYNQRVTVFFLTSNCCGAAFAAKKDFFIRGLTCFSQHSYCSFLLAQKRTKKRPPKKITSLFRGGPLMRLLYYCTSASIVHKAIYSRGQ